MHAMRGLAVLLLAGVVRASQVPPEEKEKAEGVSWGESGGIKFTIGSYANDLFHIVPRTENKILAREETKKWLGKMWSPRSLPSQIINFMRCDVCELLTPLIHDDLDHIRHKYAGKEPLATEHIDERFYHEQFEGSWCLNITNWFSLKLDKEKDKGGIAIPKYIRGKGALTVRGGWPEAFFYRTCERILEGATPDLLVDIAVARGDDKVGKWGPLGKLDVCESRFRCPPSTDQTRREQAPKLLAEVHDFDSEEAGLDEAFEGLIGDMKEGNVELKLPDEIKEVFNDLPKAGDLPDSMKKGAVPELSQEQVDNIVAQGVKSRAMSAENWDEWDTVDAASKRLLEHRRKIKERVRKLAEERARERAGKKEEL